MNANIGPGRRLVAAALAAAASLTLVQAVQARPSAPDVPDAIAVEAGHKPFLALDAEGVQIYGCTAVGDTFRWSLVAPRADLLDRNGKRVVTHFAGPSWQANDGSVVKAALERRINVDPTAVDWFLLRVTETGGHRRAARRHDVRPADPDGRRSRAGVRGLSRSDGRRGRRGALHRGLRLLEGDRQRRHRTKAASVHPQAT